MSHRQLCYGPRVPACVSGTRDALCISQREGAGGCILKSPWMGNCDRPTTTTEGSSKMFCDSIIQQQPRKTSSVGSCLGCHMLEFKETFLPWQGRIKATLWFGASQEHRRFPSCPNAYSSQAGCWWDVPPAVAMAMVLLPWAAPPHV